MFFTTLSTLSGCAALLCLCFACKKKDKRLWGIFAAIVLFLTVLLTIKAPLQRALFFYDTPAQAVSSRLPGAKIQGKVQQDNQAVIFYTKEDTIGRLCAVQTDKGWQISRGSMLQDYSLTYQTMIIDVNYLTHPDRRCVIISQSKVFQLEGYSKITVVTDSLGSEFIPFDTGQEVGFVAFLSQVPDHYALSIGGRTYEIDLSVQNLPTLLTQKNLLIPLVMSCLFLIFFVSVILLVRRIQKKKRGPLQNYPLFQLNGQAGKERTVKLFKRFYALFLLCVCASGLLLLYKLCQGSPESLLFSDTSSLFPSLLLLAALFYLVCLTFLKNLLYLHCAPKTMLLYSNWLFPRVPSLKLLHIQALLYADDPEESERQLDRLHPKRFSLRLWLLNLRSACCKQCRDREGMLRCREAMRQLTVQRSLTPQQKEILRATWTHLDYFDAVEKGDWENARTFCEKLDFKQPILTQVYIHYKLGLADLHTGCLESACSHFAFAAAYGGELSCAREAQNYLDQC